MSESFVNLSEEARSEKLLGYVKGRISDDARAEIDAACQTNPVIANELAYYQALNTATKEAPRVDVSRKDADWERLSQSLKQNTTAFNIPEAANDNTRFWRSAAAALAIMLFGSASFNAGIWDQAGDEPRYIPVSETSSDLLLKVSFHAATTEADIRELLLSIDGDIVRGPSALGLYDIRFNTAEARDKAIATLQVSEEIVETVSTN